MRRSIWLGALLVGLCMGSTASAVGVTLAGGNTGPAGNSSSPGVGLMTYIRSGFGLTNLFTNYRMNAKTQVNPTAPMPDPNSPAYLAAFGFKRLP
jgi:hypothetical protein